LSVLLYMDHHVPAAITEGVRRRGVDARTAEEDGTKRLPDPELLDRATELGRVLLTQDQDLLTEVSSAASLAASAAVVRRIPFSP
jgi:predicted nuclease of predicted toxin-antitoxin system